MASAVKQELASTYEDFLKDSPDFILTRFSGLDVEKLTELRKKLHEKEVRYKVIKNRIFKRALQNLDQVKDFPYDNLVGPIGVVFAKEDLPGAAKVLKDFAKDNDHFEIMSGVLEQAYYEQKDIESFANLPSKEQVLAQIAAGLNAPATQIASMMSQVMGSLARAIKAVGEKNG